MILLDDATAGTLPLGIQRPRVMHLPPTFCSTAGDEFIALSDSAGLVLDDWQRYHVRALTLETREGDGLRWAAMENASIVARQNGKGAIITALELGFLFHVKTPFVLHTAHETRTAKEGFQRLLDVIDGSDELRRQVVRVSRARGDEGLELTEGRRLQVVARTSGAGRGLSAQVLIWDEAYALTDEQIAAQMPVMLAQSNPWIGYFSSAAKESSAQLHSLRRRATSGTDRLVYLEHGCDPDEFGGRGSEGWAEARMRPEVWAQANPALGIRVRHDSVATLLASMAPAVADREVLGVPDLPAEAHAPLFSLADWVALADPSSEFGGRVGFAVDVAPEGAWASIALVAARPDGLPHVELVDRRPGIDWVAARRAELDAKLRPKFWVRDPAGPAVELSGKFRDMKAREVTEAATRLVTAVAGRGFRWLCDQSLEPALVSAVVGARRRDQGDGVWKWSRVGSEVDISPLVAMTWALWAAPLVARKQAILL